MSLLMLVLMGVSLAMDAFAVSICKGLAMSRLNKKQMLVIGIYFGGFQALMPLLGWLLGSQFAAYIENIDHWIAFLLLAAIGGKMVFDAIKEWGEEAEAGVVDKPLNHKEMLLLAIATSIDALAVGVTFAFLQVNIVVAITITGVVTMLISMAGVVIGNLFGGKNKNIASLAGGIVLICIGIKILLEHLSVF